MADGKQGGLVPVVLALMGVAALETLTERRRALASAPPGPKRRLGQRPEEQGGSRGHNPMAAARSGSAGAQRAIDPGKRRWLVMAIADRVGRDNLTLVAAGVAFYALLAIFPALAFLVSVFALVADPMAIADRLQQFAGILPPEAMQLITDGLTTFTDNGEQKHGLALVIGLVLTLWSAKAGMSALMTGLNIAYEEEERRGFIVQTFVALGLTLGAIVGAVVCLAAIALVPAIVAFLPLPGAVVALLSWGRWPLLAVLALLGLAVVYRYAPSRQNPKWHWITIGSTTAAALWLIGSVLFSFYVSHFGSYNATYGSLGAVVVLLLWFWVTSLIVLVGAEVDAELQFRKDHQHP